MDMVKREREREEQANRGQAEVEIRQLFKLCETWEGAEGAEGLEERARLSWVGTGSLACAKKCDSHPRW